MTSPEKRFVRYRQVAKNMVFSRTDLQMRAPEYLPSGAHHTEVDLIPQIEADRIVIGAAAPNSHANGITELRYQNFNEDPLGAVRLWFTPFPEKPIYNYDI